jgi:hypothetical protein
MPSLHERLFGVARQIGIPRPLLFHDSQVVGLRLLREGVDIRIRTEPQRVIESDRVKPNALVLADGRGAVEDGKQPIREVDAQNDDERRMDSVAAAQAMR